MWRAPASPNGQPPALTVVTARATVDQMRGRRGARRGLSLVTAFATLAVVLTAAGSAAAAVTCPNANPIVHENKCAGAGSSGYDISNFSENVGGYSTKTSYARGEDVQLKIARNAPTFPATRVD